MYFSEDYSSWYVTDYKTGLYDCWVDNQIVAVTPESLERYGQDEEKRLQLPQHPAAKSHDPKNIQLQQEHQHQPASETHSQRFYGVRGLASGWAVWFAYSCLLLLNFCMFAGFVIGYTVLGHAYDEEDSPDVDGGEGKETWGSYLTSCCRGCCGRGSFGARTQLMYEKLSRTRVTIGCHQTDRERLMLWNLDTGWGFYPLPILPLPSAREGVKCTSPTRTTLWCGSRLWGAMWEEGEWVVQRGMG